MKKQIITATIIILGTIAIFGFRFGFDNQNVFNTIKGECNCEEIVQGISLHGITYSKEIGMNLGETHNFTLRNCTFEALESDMEKLTTKLSSNIDNFCESDVVILEIKKDSEVSKKVVIKDCELTIE